MTTVVLHGMTLIDGRGGASIPDAFVRIEQQRVLEVGTVDQLVMSDQETALDLSGQTVMPGLINAHEHLTFKRYQGSFQDVATQWTDGRLLLHGAASCLVSLSEGVTTVRDIGGKGLTNLLLKQAVESGSLAGPRIVANGQPIAMTGGHGWQISREVDSADEARRAARELLHAGADFIKCMASGGFVALDQDQPDSAQLTVDEMRAAFDEAHKAGKKTTVHAHPPGAIRAAIEAGVDCVEHGALLDHPTAELMAKEGVFLVPTLSALQITAEKGTQMGRPSWLVAKSREQAGAPANGFRYALQAGVRIAAGVDSIGEMQREMELMVDNGFTAMQAIVAATSAAADCLDVADSVGTVEPGKQADMVVLDGDPLRDLAAFERVRYVFKGGVQYQPADLKAALGRSMTGV